jgi:hypothetical protein
MLMSLTPQSERLARLGDIALLALPAAKPGLPG